MKQIDPLIKEYLSYDPDSGLITWIKKPARNIVVGSVAGCVHPTGYRSIILNKKGYRAHRIAYYLYYGYIDDDKYIDHINGLKDDNRIKNLRLVTSRQNQSNLNRHRNGGLIGASFYKRDGNWRSSIYNGEKVVHLGYYDNKEDAHMAYVKAREEL